MVRKNLARLRHYQNTRRELWRTPSKTWILGENIESSTFINFRADVMKNVKLETLYRCDSIEAAGNSGEMNFATHMCWSVIYFGLLRLTTTSSTIFFERNKNKCGIIGMNNWFLLSLCSTLPREWLSRLYTSLMNPMAPSILVWFLFYSGQTKGDLLIRSPHMTPE